MTAEQGIDLLRIYFSRRLADTSSVHGVFMDVLGMGVLITGDSGVGKSELALELMCERALERRTFGARIADHAKNVAEEVVYLCEAQDIRHAGK